MNLHSFLDAGFDGPLFLSTFLAIAIAELPDKTALATVMLATGNRPFAVFLGVASAFVIQSLVAVTCGSFLGLLPASVVRIGSGLLFLVFAVAMWRRRDEGSQGTESADKAVPGFWRTCWTSFVVIFIAEWGDLTQLATATLTAKYANALTIFIAATFALWAISALAVFVGHHLKGRIQVRLLSRIAAITFAVIGFSILLGVHA